MPLNFPSAPTVNTTYTLNNKTWTYNGNAWALSTGGSLNTSVVPEGSNLYFSNARVYSNVSQLGYITSSSLSGYATNTQLGSYATNAQLALYATTSNVALKANIADLTAANITGTTLNSSIVSSSLTSVGTLGSLAVTNNVSAGAYLTAGNSTAANFQTTGNVNTNNLRVVTNSSLGTVVSGTWNGASITTAYTDAKVTSVNGQVGDATGFATTANSLSQFASTTSAQLATLISDETGSGVLVFGTSPAITTSLTTPSTSFDLINTTATTVNFAKAATTLSIGASTGTTTVNNGLVVTGDLTVNGTTTTVNATTITVDDKNIELGSVASPTDVTAEGGGITLKGATDKTLSWVGATAAWTSSEDFNLLTGKAYEINGTSVLSSTTLGSGVVNSSLTSVGTLGSLAVTNNVSAGAFLTAGNSTAANFQSSGNVNTASALFTGSVTGGTIQTAGNVNSNNLRVVTASSLGTVQSGTWNGSSISTTYTDAKVVSVNGSTGAVTGLATTTGTLAQFGATTSSQLAGVISDETGSGALVFATSPTLVTPALGTPSSGTLTNCTFPTLNQNTTGTAAGLSATLAIASGGTGTTTAQGAMNAFAGAVTSGSYLRGNGTNVVMSAIQAADVPTLNQNTTGSAATATTATNQSGGTVSATSVSTSGTYTRSAAGKGYLDGAYAGIETTATSGAIYSIGGSYVPGSTTLGTMYGIGYSYSGYAMGNPGGAPSNLWGMYVADNGTARLFLDGTNGRGYFASNLYVNSGSLVLSAGNYNSYAPTLTGTGASGTWSINVTGSAGSATTATTATNATNSAVTDDTTTNSTHYPNFVSGTSGNQAEKVSSTKFTFNPSTGLLTSTDYNSSSDKRLKKNIKTVDNALDKVMALRGVSFDWKEGGAKAIGLIAQEAEKVIPEIVSKDDNGYLGIKYNNLIGVLVEAIKDQQEQINILKKQIEKL
jgi:hypothetical protein